MFAACPLENANPLIPPSRIAIVRSNSCLVGFSRRLYAKPVDSPSSGWRNVAAWKIGMLTAPVSGSVPGRRARPWTQSADFPLYQIGLITEIFHVISSICLDMRFLIYIYYTKLFIIYSLKVLFILQKVLFYNTVIEKEDARDAGIQKGRILNHQL